LHVMRLSKCTLLSLTCYSHPIEGPFSLIAMETLDDLIYWASQEGLEWDGIEPQRIPGRGVGVVATRALEVMNPANYFPY
jgi:hypothetical protein